MTHRAGRPKLCGHKFPTNYPGDQKRFSCYIGTMSDTPVQIRTRKFIRNALLQRRQFVSLFALPDGVLFSLALVTYDPRSL